MNTNQISQKKEILVDFKSLDKKYTQNESYTSGLNVGYVPMRYTKKHPTDKKR